IHRQRPYTDYPPSIHILSPFSLSQLPPPPTPTLFPYTTLFRSHQGEVRQGGVSYQNQVRPDGQGEQGHAGQDAVVEGHPGPADPVPGQGELPVAPHILIETLVGLTVPVEDLHHLHAVDVLHDDVVHLLGTGVVYTQL